jgi:hypothetical protein
MAIQQQIQKIRGIADIVFCIDFSGSMENCINGVKNHITTFVHSLEKSNTNVAIDWRIGFLGFSDKEFIQYSLKKDAYDFADQLTKATVDGYDEFTSGAIDYCISGFEWRPVSNKFLLLFTDESLESGSFVTESINLFPQLITKIADSRIHFLFFGPECLYYNQFETISRSIRYKIEDSFASVDFSSLMQSLGKTVSQSCQNQSDSALADNVFLFDLSSIHVNKVF